MSRSPPEPKRILGRVWPGASAVLVASLAVFCATHAAAQTTCDRSPILVRNARLWTGSGVASARDILFENDRVAAIAAAGSIKPSGSMREIDGKGQTLLPGLIDLHVHFGVPGGLPPSSAPSTNWEITGRQLLRSGVTSVRTHMTSLTGAALIAKDAANPCAPLPRLQFSGPEICGGIADTQSPNFMGVRSAQDAAEKVQRVADAKLQWISLYDPARFSPDELVSLKATARQAGIRLMAPIGNAQEMEASLSAGVDTIDDIDTTSAERYPDGLLRKLKASPNVTLVPTIGYAYRLHAFDRDPRLLDTASHYEFMTSAERDFVAATARDAFQKDGYVVNNRRVYATLAAKFRQLLATGAPIAIGTDVGSADHFHAGAIWWELEAWRAFGARPRAALVAATISAAHVLRDDRAGNLKEGSYADFVLYAGDAEKSRFELTRVRAVAKGGVLFVRDGAWVGPAREGVAL
jgi:imidazolonepropionase-like amidohydrolase